MQAVLAGLDPASVDADLVPALAAAFRGFDFSLAQVDDEYWRDARSVIRSDGTRVGELRPWMMAELAKDIDGLVKHMRAEQDTLRAHIAEQSENNAKLRELNDEMLSTLKGDQK